MKTSIFILLLTAVGYTSFSQSKSNKQKETIVLVHGSWSSASAWDAVTPILKAKGYDVITVNLPGHGTDTTSFATIDFKTYVKTVEAAIGDKKGIILLGHSMAGEVISQVAEEIPGQLKELIYLAAYLPKNGESILALATADAGSHAGKYLVIDKDHGTATLAKDGIVDVFAQDAPKPVQDYLVANFKLEPLAPLATPVTLTDTNFGSVYKVYIHTLNDHTISYAFQQKMVKASNVKKTFELPSSHTPFLSMPDKLAEVIIKAAK